MGARGYFAVLLEPPELAPDEPVPDEEPEDPDEDPELAGEADEEPESPFDSDFASVLVSDFASVLAAPSPEPFLELEYRSLYQPPPFNMNAVWLISRSTASWPHVGQVLIGASLIFCHSSN